MDRTALRTLRALVFLMMAVIVPVHATIMYTTVQPDTLTVGDRIQFQVSIVAPSGATIIPPPVDSGFGNFVVKQWNTDKQQRSNSDSLTFSYLLTTYTVKPCSIPELRFVQVHQGVTDTLYSQAKPMRVMSVVKGDTVDLKDLKALQIAGKPSWIWLWLILGAAALIGGILLTKYLLSLRTKAVAVPPPKPPYEEALEALAALEAKQYIQKGLIREYVFEISDILKRYIERRYLTLAMEFTTEEMLDWIRQSPLSKDERSCVEWFFRTSDPVKFAKFIPDSATVGRFGEEVRKFLTLTRPVPIAETAQQASPATSGSSAGSTTTVAQS